MYDGAMNSLPSSGEGCLPASVASWSLEGYSGNTRKATIRLKSYTTFLVDVAARLSLHPYSSSFPFPSLPRSSNLVSISVTSRILFVGTMFTRLLFSFGQLYAAPRLALLAGRTIFVGTV